MRALIVDDNDANRYYLEVLLAGNGYETDAARNGIEALDKARQAPPDIVISDLLMPGMDGFTLLRRWRADMLLQAIPFVIYTATYKDIQDQELALGFGADAFIIKPAEPDAFIEELQAVQARALQTVRAAPTQTVAEDSVLLEQYNQRLVQKLEAKMLQLEEANEALTREIAERTRLSETQRAILDTLPTEVALLDANGAIVAVNEAWKHYRETDVLANKEAPGENYIAVCEGVEGEFAHQAHQAATGIRQVLSGSTPEFSFVYRCPISAKQSWYRLIVTPLPGEPVSGAVVMHLDVTGPKEQEDRLRQQAALLDNATDAILVRDLEHRIRYWNRGAERLYGWSREEAEDRRFEDLLNIHNRPLFAAAMGQVLEHGSWSGRLSKTTKDKRTITVDASWTLVRDEEGKPVSIFCIDTDVTARLELERRLAQSQRLEAVGHLTGGVAHDFNNLLSVISGNLELLRDDLREQPAMHRMVSDALRAAGRGATLTRSLLAFSRQQPLAPITIEPNELMREMLSLLGRTMQADIEISFVAGSTWHCDVDIGQLQNALLNLAVNARDAMPDGGRLTLETRDVSLGAEDAVAQIDIAPGDYLMIAVSDTGIGMSPEVAAQVFEPFFTTKPVGQGTGLGLSMVYGFARQSGGSVKIYSEVGEGTTVRLYLPRSTGVVEPAAPAPKIHVTTAGETVLVVEDDEDMRALCIELLKSLGYLVLAAEEPRVALETLKNEPQIRVMLTDVVMPGRIDVRSFAETALGLRPDLKIVYMSGYAENALFHHGRLDPGVLLLPKPFRKRELADKIQEALDG